MTGVRNTITYFCTLLLAFISKMHASSLPPFSQKIWLSEYGYVEESSKIKQVSLTVDQTEDLFSNSFLTKTDQKVVIHGNLSFVVFTCEAEYPVSWFVKQELKLLSEGLRTRTCEFQSVSKSNKTYFRSSVEIYLEHLEFHSDTEAYYGPAYSENWEFSCQKISANSSCNDGPSITLHIEQSMNTDQNLKHLNLQLNEKIKISILTRQDNSSLNASDYNLNYVYRHYPNFDDRPIMLEKNFTVDLYKAKDSIVDKIKLVEYDDNKHIKEGDLVQIICFCSRKFYSYGVYIEMLWENGTRVKLPEEVYGFNVNPEIYLSANSKQIAERMLLDDDDSAEWDMLYFLSKEIRVDLNIKEINCHVPVWVNGKWEKLSREINVLPK